MTDQPVPKTETKKRGPIAPAPERAAKIVSTFSSPKEIVDFVEQVFELAPFAAPHITDAFAVKNGGV